MSKRNKAKAAAELLQGAAATVQGVGPVPEGKLGEEQVIVPLEGEVFPKLELAQPEPPTVHDQVAQPETPPVATTEMLREAYGVSDLKPVEEILELLARVEAEEAPAVKTEPSLPENVQLQIKNWLGNRGVASSSEWDGKRIVVVSYPDFQKETFYSRG